MSVETKDAAALLDRIAPTRGKVLVMGSMNADYTVTTARLPQPGETVNGGPLSILPGGKSANQAAAASRLGAHVELLGAVGFDENADFLLGELGKARVDTSAIRHVPGPSGTTVITVDERGENTIVYSAGSNATVTADIVHQWSDELTSGTVLGLCLESPMDAVLAAASIAHEAGLPVLLNNSPFTADLPAQLIADTDILLVNEHEMADLLGVDAPQDGDWRHANWADMQRRLENLGFASSIVTLGAAGVVVMDGDDAKSPQQLPAVKVHPVDTTGCGDAFMGTVLAGLASGLSLSECAHVATAVAAYAAIGRGAQASYGDAEQIKHFLAER